MPIMAVTMPASSSSVRSRTKDLSILRASDGKAFQMGQTRITSTKIIQCKRHADKFQFFKHVSDGSRIVYQRRLRKLEFQIARLQARLF